MVYGTVKGRVKGWILDLYPSPEGMTLWLVEPDGTHRHLIDRRFTPSFYVQGPEARLMCLAQWLASRRGCACRLVEKLSLFDRRALRVLEVRLRRPTDLRGVVGSVHRYDSNFRLYNSDLMLAPLYCWERGVFPLARVEVETCDGAEVISLECRDDPWALDYELPPLRTLQLRLEGLGRVNPTHGRRGSLEVEIDGERRLLDGADEPVWVSVHRLLKRYDPDLIVTEWGDTTLLPGLERQARRYGVQLALNRDGHNSVQSRGRSYMSYGRVLFKGSATTLRGRLHVDVRNSFIADKCELDGLWELARVTKLPVQYAARTTTGTGISHMQMELAYHDGVLIPEQKAEPEDPKHPDELLTADRGGLVFLPRLGFFTNVGELDFASEYPNIMARFNVSPETLNCPCCPEAPRVPELGYRVCRRQRGITSRVVERLIRKREQYKRRKQSVPDEVRRSDAVRRDAMKWLLVCCFGYTGYKNARFGKIEAHEAINALAREKLLVAKETAEQRGFRVLHALVDSLYVQKEGATQNAYQQLAREIEQRTSLPIALEAVYRYVVFLPSKQYAEIPVPNRFFCVSTEGEVKVRGLECRKHDTPPLVAEMQREVLEILAEADEFETYCRRLEEARRVFARYLERVEEGTASIEELVISKRLTRPPGDYLKDSLTAIAARQLDRAGVGLRPGEMVEYVLTDFRARYADDRVRAFTLWQPWQGYDAKKYAELLREAFEPFEHFAGGSRTSEAFETLFSGRGR